VEEGTVVSLDENKALARRLYEEVFGRGNLDAADAILTVDCVSHGPGVPATTGTESIKRQAMLLRTAIPDLRVTLDDQVAEGDRVTSRWKGSGTHSGPLMMPAGTIPPTGRSITFDEIRIDRCAGGRIVESWFIPDRLGLWQQLGLIPAPAPPSG
jgi:predicted ester cyclase